MPSESTPLVSFGTQGNAAPRTALDQSSTALSILGTIQVVLVLFLSLSATYDEVHNYSPAEYVVFRDIIV
jgi:hypothetical protein